MRFRAHQEDAKALTRRLIVLFVIIVVATVFAVDALAKLVWHYEVGVLMRPPKHFTLINCLVSVGIILGGCLVQFHAMRKGGSHVATLLGGREIFRINPGIYKRLFNVVDETALAAGVRSPRIFVIDDDAINACAAGWEASDCVICVTSGAYKRLTRNELHGVVAHEFSHILHGDTRLNIRLSCLVFGLQSIFLIGTKIVGQGADRRKTTVLSFLGLAMIAAGSLGWLSGRVLQAAISRQREYLADASAVQYTRLTEGLGGALRKIDHQVKTTDIRFELESETANLVSHMMLSPPGEMAASFFSTHPKISDRLAKLYGRYVPPLPSDELAPDEIHEELRQLKNTPQQARPSIAPQPQA